MSGDRFGLYYPDIRFDDDWLRIGALYWPKLARIVPRGLRPEDDEDTRLLISELDFVLDVAPDDAAASIAGTFLDLLAAHGQELVGTHGIRPEDVRSIDWQGGWFAEIDTVRGIYPAKLDSRVHDAMATLGLTHGVPAPGSTGGPDGAGGPDRGDDFTFWLLMESRLAELYMCVLAGEIARQNPVLQPVTNYPGFCVAAGDWTLDRLAYALLAPEQFRAAEADSGDPASIIAFLALEMVMPAPADGGSWSRVPMAKIVEIRRRYGADFLAFRLEVEAVAAEVAQELAQVRDPTVLDAYLRHVADTRLVRPARDLRRALRGMRVDVAAKAVTLKLEVPALAALAAGGGLVAHQPVLAGGSAIAAGLLNLGIAARRHRAGVTTPSAASYLAEARQIISPREGVEKLLGGFQRVGAKALERHNFPFLGGAL